MANDLRWNPVSVNFNDSAAFMNSAGNNFSRAGTVFGELRKQILEKEQRDIENAYKERALQQTIDAENRLHEYRMATAKESERHNLATEAYYKGMLDYHNAHLRAQTELGQERNRILNEQLKVRENLGNKTRTSGGNFPLQELFPTENFGTKEQSASPVSPIISGKASQNINDSTAQEYIQALRDFYSVDDPSPEQEDLLAKRKAELQKRGIDLNVLSEHPLVKDYMAGLDNINQSSPVENINRGNPTSSTNSSTLSQGTAPINNFYDILGKGLLAGSALAGSYLPARLNLYDLKTLSENMKEEADEKTLKKNVPTYVYGDTLIEDPQGFYKSYDDAIKKVTDQQKTEGNNSIDFSHLTNNEKLAMVNHNHANDSIRNFGDRWFANTFFGSADAMVLSASATENEAQYKLRSNKELAALKQIYSSGNPELQQFVLGRLKQGATSPNPDIAAKCKLGYMYLNSALTSKEYGTSVGGLQALDSMYINSRFPTKESAVDIAAYQQKRQDKSKEQIEQGRRLTRLIEDPLDFSKFGGNKASLENAEYKNLRRVVNVANHTDIPKEWGYGPTNKLARAAALRLTLNQLGTKEKALFGNVVNANDSAWEIYQHAKDLNFFKKSTTEGNLFHEYYRTLYHMSPSEIYKFMESIQSSK